MLYIFSKGSQGFIFSETMLCRSFTAARPPQANVLKTDDYQIKVEIGPKMRTLPSLAITDGVAPFLKAGLERLARKN